MKRQPEFELQKCVCSYLRAAHPSILFMSDTIASLKLTKWQAVRNSQIQKPGFKTPDVLVFCPKGKYSGLFIELKTESPYKLNGGLKSNAHIQEQFKTIEKLRELGYYADFAWNFKDIVSLINRYLNEKL
ncbi:hypothetical protein SAMN05421682_11598 [Chryseobacterium indoltheticum]|uniref:VRR-NUC domain-containing protein n=2 Tax=Chryseobacterium indoltheticum TaxID=254 RepID=A0A381FAA2_9FLAO|nr:hypothetical protein [Chryseobacterium indoltheticum]SIR24426.1 hypothetical protein SAMN05421682_11598 [Chryseobacterium indoltheticum]SUX43500.1 Uncharacterised protein [Chryseobacterium indoltheticum]